MKQNKITLKIEDLNLTAEDVVKYYYRAFGCYSGEVMACTKKCNVKDKDVCMVSE